MWAELIGPDKPLPNLAWLDTYSPQEVQTALATLLMKIHSSHVKTPKGLFKHLLRAIHAGEREPRNYTPDELRRIAAGCLPEHTRKIHTQPTPEVPNEVPQQETPPLPDRNHTDTRPSQKSADHIETMPRQGEPKKGDQDEGTARKPEDLALEIIGDRTISTWEVVCRSLIQAADDKQFHDLDAVNAIHRAWRVSGNTASRMLREVRAYLQAQPQTHTVRGAA